MRIVGVGWHLVDRDEGQAEVAESVQQSVQGRLVHDKAAEGADAVGCGGEGEAVEPVGPPRLETSADALEVAHILEDILPARSLVIEFAARLAVRRANKSDCERLQDISDLLIAAFQRGDPVVIGRGFHRWLDALIDAGHSVAIRWIANPFLEAYRDVLDRFPALWVLEPSFPEHLREFTTALSAGDEEHAVETTRHYYRRVDAAFMKALEGAIAARGAAASRSDGKSDGVTSAPDAHARSGDGQSDGRRPSDGFADRPASSRPPDKRKPKGDSS